MEEDFIDLNASVPPNFAVALKDIYPGVPDAVVQEIIQLVQEGSPHDPYELKLANMENLLSEYGAWGPPPSATDEEIICGHYHSLLTIFSDACPDSMMRFCREQPPGATLDDMVLKICTEGYDKAEVDPLTIWEQLKDALPDADPCFLKKEAIRLALLTMRDVENFLQNAIEKGDYPTMRDYLKQKKEHDELAIYKQFDIEKFLLAIPNPVEYFANPERAVSLDENSSENDIEYALVFLYNNYSFIRKKYINLIFQWKYKNLIEVCDRLDKMSKSLKKPRKQVEMFDTNNKALVQEVAYLKNRRLIKRVLKLRDEAYRLQKEEARMYNLLEQCQCCFEEELIPEECFFCLQGCVFCKECVKKGTENAIGKGDLKFPCFANCKSEFSLKTLQMVLPSNIFERLAQKISSEEAKKANLEGLETCPFCDFAMIVPENEKIFKCINQDCLIESCRECRHKSHIPLRCSEIEYDEDVQRRTYIENKMTEALTRTCHSCKKVFIKENGCNKMTCQCGAKQCYLCGAAIDNYSHFRSSGCALFTNDNEVNLQRVVSSATSAKRELGNVQIKFDPSANIETYFRN